VLERRVADLEGGVAALSVATGQAALYYTFANVADHGGNIVSAPTLYGATHTLLAHVLPRQGVNVRFAQGESVADMEKAIDADTRAVFCESVGNPAGNICDIAALAEVAHLHGLPLIVDNTVPTPWLIRPLEWGADIVVHSATKFIGGHGTSIGGVIVDGGSFDFSANDKYPGFTEPDPSYHGLQFWPALGPGSFIIKARVQLLRDVGAAVSPFNAFLFLQGVETLSLRVERHNQNALAVAQYLEDHDQVESVQYAGLPSSPWHERALQYTGGRGFGSVPAFIIQGGAEAGQRFVEALELHSHVANIGDVRSLAIHPATTTHSQLTVDEQRDTGVDPGLVRLSVGIEDVADIIADLDRGFAAARS